ncbi:GGDEF domain-containing protein [Psychrobacter sp. 16-MNA-CIBAN-0192]|uniref:GGDEF domain-containing protein n=1 Tax=Psychrobacter sp. 16-MNA-CIBAN-0192 TaxID=3140448 RepID=UPI00332F7E6E
MAVSIYQLSYKNLTRVIFEWQAADKASLLALFIVMEVSLHWLWCLFVWLRRDMYGKYVDMTLLYSLWAGVTVLGLYFWFMVGHFARIKNDSQRLHYWQVALIIIYSLYITVMVLVMGHSSLVSGVSLMGGAMLGMMLLRRRYIWYAFLWQIVFIIIVTLIPYLGINMPNLRQLTITSIPLDTYSYLTYSETTTLENAITASIFKNGTISWEMVHKLRLSSSFFWRSTHLYLALPKAIFMVYVFRLLLLIVDNSKKEILQHANQDGLTNLNNRRFGLSRMQQTIVTTSAGHDTSVILMDLDWFKSINDKYGHEVGDQVLCDMAKILTHTFADQGVVSRYGGEEFLVMLPDTGHDQAMALAEQLRENIAEHIVQLEGDAVLQVTASMGLYTLVYDKLQRIKQEWKPADTSLSTGNWTISNGGSFINLKAHASARSLELNGHYRSKPRLDKRAVLNLNQQQQELFASEICNCMISTADKALYKAKERGRNRVLSANELLAKGIILEPHYGT